MTDTEVMRREFEAWHDGMYCGQQEDIAFSAWQAATAQAMAAERERLEQKLRVYESLLKQCSAHLMAWATKYGNNNPSWLPPALHDRLKLQAKALIRKSIIA